MDNRIGKTVVFTKDLWCSFLPENIEQLKVYNLLTRKLDTCEFLGELNGIQNYRIADFNMDVHPDKIRFFFGDPPAFGFSKEGSGILRFLPVGTTPYPKGWITVGHDTYEEEYRIPVVMWDFANFIDNFLIHVMNRRQQMRFDHVIKQRLQGLEITHMEVDSDDLPF